MTAIEEAVRAREELDEEIPRSLLKRLRESARRNATAYVPAVESREAINLIASAGVGGERDRRWCRMMREELARIAPAPRSTQGGHDEAE